MQREHTQFDSKTLNKRENVTSLRQFVQDKARGGGWTVLRLF